MAVCGPPGVDVRASGPATRRRDFRQSQAARPLPTLSGPRYSAHDLPQRAIFFTPASTADCRRRDPPEGRLIMTRSRHLWLVFASLFLAITMTILPAAAQQQQQRKPNILVIMGDDVGWFNIGAYHQGIMSGKTPNLDRLASEGMRFTDYYAEASCTAGRANFITGELPIRTGLTTVGQAGADVGIPAQAVTLATALKAQGYATGQFGKNHLGDLNKFLPTVHGCDEFFGYLYHLDAMSDPYWFDYPQDWLDKTGPRNLVHCWTTDTDDPTEMPRWGKVGKQRIVDEGPLAPFPDMAGRQNWQEG